MSQPPIRITMDKYEALIKALGNMVRHQNSCADQVKCEVCTKTFTDWKFADAEYTVAIRNLID